jgi:hypothetical protein
LFPFQESDDDEDIPPEHPRLKPVNIKRVPRSWNPRQKLLEEAQRAEQGDEMDVDESDGDGDGDLGLDQMDVEINVIDEEDDDF